MCVYLLEGLPVGGEDETISRAVLVSVRLFGGLLVLDAACADAHVITQARHFLQAVGRFIRQRELGVGQVALEDNLLGFGGVLDIVAVGGGKLDSFDGVLHTAQV